MTKIIWTNHVAQRLKERRIPQGLIIQAILDPEKTEVDRQGVVKYCKKIGIQTVTALVKKNGKGEEVIVSAWADPPNPGTNDARNKKRYLEMQKASFWKKFWLTFLGQIGL